MFPNKFHDIFFEIYFLKTGTHEELSGREPSANELNPLLYFLMSFYPNWWSHLWEPIIIACLLYRIIPDTVAFSLKPMLVVK